MALAVQSSKINEFQTRLPKNIYCRSVFTPVSAADAFGHGADNHLENPDSAFSKYLKRWSLTSLVKVDRFLREDDPENDLQVSKMLVDFMKRLEINSVRLTDLQQRIEGFHGRLDNLKREYNENGKELGNLQETIHMLETELKTLRNLQRLHYDTWESAKDQYMQWSPDGDDDIDNDDDCEDPIVVLDPKKRLVRWNAMVAVATEVQARHAMTIEQMSELVIRLKEMKNTPQGESFETELEEIYDVVCAFLRCRMTQQLLSQHLAALGKDALGTSVAKKKEAELKRARKAKKKDYKELEKAAAKSGKVVGEISLDAPVAHIVQSSVTEASQLCDATYLVSPPVSFVLTSDGEPFGEIDDLYHETTTSIYEGVTATFVRSWLQYTLIELLKNSMAATVESNPDIAKAALEDDFSGDSDEVQQQLPPLYLHVFEDEENENIVIKIYDQGGGVKDEVDLESLFRFGQRDTVWDRMDEQQTYSRKSLHDQHIASFAIYCFTSHFSFGTYGFGLQRSEALLGDLGLA